MLWNCVISYSMQVPSFQKIIWSTLKNWTHKCNTCISTVCGHCHCVASRDFMFTFHKWLILSAIWLENNCVTLKEKMTQIKFYSLWIWVAVNWWYLAFYEVECDQEILVDVHVLPYTACVLHSRRAHLRHNRRHRWLMLSEIYFCYAKGRKKIFCKTFCCTND